MWIPILSLGLLGVAVAGAVFVFVRSLRRQGAMLRDVRSEIKQTSAATNARESAPEPPGKDT